MNPKNVTPAPEPKFVPTVGQHVNLTARACAELVLPEDSRFIVCDVYDDPVALGPGIAEFETCVDVQLLKGGKRPRRKFTVGVRDIEPPGGVESDPPAPESNKSGPAQKAHQKTSKRQRSLNARSVAARVERVVQALAREIPKLSPPTKNLGPAPGVRNITQEVLRQGVAGFVIGNLDPVVRNKSADEGSTNPPPVVDTTDEKHAREIRDSIMAYNREIENLKPADPDIDYCLSGIRASILDLLDLVLPANSPLVIQDRVAGPIDDADAKRVIMDVVECLKHTHSRLHAVAAERQHALPAMIHPSF